MEGMFVAVDLYSTRIVSREVEIPARIVLKIGRLPKRKFLLARQLFAYRCVESLNSQVKKVHPHHTALFIVPADTGVVAA